MKMSPEPLPATLPVRARPRAARRASRFSWCGRSGASVADDDDDRAASPALATEAVAELEANREPGDPELVAQAVVGLDEHARPCSRPSLRASTRETVPMPPLNS